MSSNKKNTVWVIGHKNPDTDSICAAIAYANLKNITEEDEYIPKKAGNINEETRYVLKRFGVKPPQTVSDVGAQIKDIDYRHTPGVDGHISLKKAWEMMKSENVVTLPVVAPNGKLNGVIVNGDIAYAYMDVYDNRVLSEARTQYKNMIEILNGNMHCGNEHAYFMNGKVVVTTSNRDDIRDEVEGDDLVIVGNVIERQRIVLERIPSCMIITGATTVDPEILKTAEAIDCVVITTEFDSFTTARLINQSIPIRYLMTREKIVSFDPEDYVDDVKETVSKVRHRDFPILDEDYHYIGMFSRRNLLNPEKKRVILVDHNEKSQAVDGIDDAAILEIIDHHKLGSLETIQPIYFRNQPVGCCSTIVAMMYEEKKAPMEPHIAGLLLSAILSDTLMFRSPTCTQVDIKIAKKLAKIAGVDYEELAMSMFEAGSNFNGRTIEQIFYQDFKSFNLEDITFGVSQVSAVSEKQLAAISDDLQTYLEKVLTERNLDMVFVMLTDILDQKTRLLFAGHDAETVARRAFHQEAKKTDKIIVPGLVSRKKQLIPAVIETLQAMAE